MGFLLMMYNVIQLIGGVMIVLIGSHKGGVGKSTILINLLMFLKLKTTQRIAVLECDEQHSVKMWLDERREKGMVPDVDYFECYTHIPDTAHRLANKHDLVMMDAPGSKSPEFRKCLAVADLFISLIDPTSQVEINTLGELVVDVRQAQTAINPKLKAMIVMNRCPTHPGDQDASTFRKMMNDDPDWLPVARQRLFTRTSYKRAYNEGMAVHEYNDKSGNKARAEIELLATELKLYSV
ncbi:ParA family protein [Serratia sp. UGAL515B_01]|uniref:ParA family protein n=1 Tax=Serratia sp. UGAL515B_01 TaxID=2986763 RepID=UPI0029549C21|nr:ParA family protein [Serratia sp. UGAL515B_01]WON75557.1 ParA family protein [Serratia sp. UGAL515B_01]